MQKSTTFYGLFLLMIPHIVHASHTIEESSQQLHQSDPRVLVWEKRNALISGYCSQYKVPISLFPFIRNLLYGNTRKESLAYLAGQDLRGIDFTGCKFIDINLTNTNLQDVILKSTTCDYLKAFEHNKRNMKTHARLFSWYAIYIPQYLNHISTTLYKKVKSHQEKAKLLHIASAFSRLPFFNDKELNIKSQYWCWEFKILHDKYNGDSTLLQFDKQIEQDLKNDCWRTKYMESTSSLPKEKLHADFLKYLQDFNKGLLKYKDDSWIDPSSVLSDLQSASNNYFARHIRASIKGLEKAYPKIKSKEFQQKACEIADALSKSYRFEKEDLYHHYLECQNSLIWLKEMTGVECIYYHYYKYGTVETWE